MSQSETPIGDQSKPRFRHLIRARGGGTSFGGQSKQSDATLKSLAKTLGNVDHELQLLSHASKYSWVNQRLILLRNSLIALGVLVTVVSIPEAKFTLQSVFDICAI